jgi:hypothetical protein
LDMLAECVVCAYVAPDAIKIRFFADSKHFALQ